MKSLGCGVTCLLIHRPSRGWCSSCALWSDLAAVPSEAILLEEMALWSGSPALCWTGNCLVASQSTVLCCCEICFERTLSTRHCMVQ